MKVLLTNCNLIGRGGTQLYVRDVAVGLLRRGHHPFVYSPLLGAIARELREASVPVVDDLDRLEAAPDIIHGHHTHELMVALLRYPGVPAIRVCHGSIDDPPLHFPRVVRYVAVDDTTRDRCTLEWGLPETQVEVLLNFVDLARFAPRAPLPERPMRALVFSNTAHVHARPIAQACAAEGITVDVVGESAGTATDRPEAVLPRYDLVFAKGRAALEAMATGVAVILCDKWGLGPMVTSSEFDRLRPLNFGLRTLQDALDPGAIRQQILRYDAADAAAVSTRVRREADSGTAIDHLVEMYEEVVAEYAAGEAAVTGLELRAAARYLHSLNPKLQRAERSGVGHALSQRMYWRAIQWPVIGRVLRSRAGRTVRIALLERRGV